MFGVGVLGRAILRRRQGRRAAEVPKVELARGEDHRPGAIQERRAAVTPPAAAMENLTRMTDISAVLFDADGVIQRAPRDLHNRLTGLLGGAADAREACMAEIFAAEAPALVGEADFGRALAPVIAHRGAACTVDAILALWRTIEVDRSVLVVVAELRRAGVYCALASSQERHRARYMSEQLGYGALFDAEFYSCELGCAKPDPRFFAEIVRRAALSRERTLFIDDRVEHVEAARAVGLHAAQFVLGDIGSGGQPLRVLLATFGLPTG